MTIEFYTDGACQPNPGRGGYGYIQVVNGEEISRGSGGNPQTTNNQMELMGVIAALESTGNGVEVTVITDSQYVKNGITGWIHSWKKNGWRTASKKPVLNKELWERLDLLTQTRKITWKWVRGHTGDHFNELVDQLAVSAIP